jgi:hypothetical protein
VSINVPYVSRTPATRSDIVRREDACGAPARSGMVRPTEGRPMLVPYPHRIVTYVNDDQLAAIRA